jgi:hypothetical protein
MALGTVLVALATEDTESAEKATGPKDKTILVNERGLGAAGSQRKLQERVEVEILRVKTALRMTRTG